MALNPSNSSSLEQLALKGLNVCFEFVGISAVNCLERLGSEMEIWHGRLFTSAKAPIGGITLVAVYSAWAAGTEDI